MPRPGGIGQAVTAPPDSPWLDTDTDALWPDLHATRFELAPPTRTAPWPSPHSRPARECPRKLGHAGELLCSCLSSGGKCTAGGSELLFWASLVCRLREARAARWDRELVGNMAPPPQCVFLMVAMRMSTYTSRPWRTHNGCEAARGISPCARRSVEGPVNRLPRRSRRLLSARAATKQKAESRKQTANSL